MKQLAHLVMIGAGNMAEALLKGILGHPRPIARSITVTDIRKDRLDELALRYSVHTSESNRQAVGNAEVVILAVKPQNVSEVLADLSGVMPPDTVIISLIAGLRTESIETRLGGCPHVVRAMPNTPALVGAGVAALCPGRWASSEDMERADQIFLSVGQTVRVEESLMDAVTAVSGSGPAYVCVLVEAMLDAARRMGLSREVARTLTLATIEGTGRMLAETGLDPAEARARVTSKGGTTESAIRVLCDRAVPESILSAMEAACARSKELSGKA